jgi:hypothetical protein
VGPVRFELANFQIGAFIDNIGDTNERANGSAYVEVEYDDGSRGILGIGCHGPGAPPGIDEGGYSYERFRDLLERAGPGPRR